MTATLADVTAKSQSAISQRSFYRPELDALRFFAFMMVFICHSLPHHDWEYGWMHNVPLQGAVAALAASLWTGVCVFFTLSAYLIVTLLLRERDTTGDISLRNFYVRRVLRIWPLYFLALGIGFAVTQVTGNQLPVFTWICFLLFFVNIPTDVVSGAGIVGFGHLWSISAEEQFYLLVPGLVKKGSARALLLLCGAIAFIANAWLILLPVTQRAHLSFGLTRFFLNFYLFVPGVIVALYTRKYGVRDFSAITRWVFLVGGVGFCFASAYLFGAEGTGISIIRNASIFFGALLLLLSFLGSRFRFPRFVTYLGKISYGLYVYHVWCLHLVAHLLLKLHGDGPEASLGPALSLIKFPVAWILSVALASASYQFFERYFLRLKDRFAIIHTRPV